jgi:hypothetical protein
MKKALVLLLFIAGVLTNYAQPLTGIKTIPGDFANLTVAVDSLNAKGVGTGGVTFQVSAGLVFNLTANPYALKITATGTAANPIVFEKAGVGANPLLQITGGSGTTDAGIWLDGSDYVTVNGIDIRNAGASTADYLEYGFFLSGSATDGCNHNTLKNLTVRMANNQTTAIAIYAVSAATSIPGKNTKNTIENITIKNSIRGIQFIGLAGFEDIGNKIQQVTIDSCGVAGSTAFGINMHYQDSSIITGSVLSNIIGNTMYVIQMNFSGNFTITEDTLRNLTNGSAGTLYGIYFPSSFGNNLVKGNVVHSVTSSGGGINPIFRQIGSSTNHITENIIYNISGSYTGGQVFGIIARDGTAIDYIYRNSVHNLTSAGNLGAIGTLYTSAATNTEYIYNNFVYDLKGPATSSTYMIAGYYFIGGAVKFYYNTAYINYTSTSSTNTSAALYVNPANGATLDSRNNILVNATNVTTGTRAVAFWWIGTSLTNLAATCNNNLLYAGIPGTKNLIFYNGTTAYQTLANYKTVVSPREASSVTEMPPFISAVTPYNLHINPGVLTQAESGGQVIATPNITTDFDNEIRWGNPGYIGTGTAPDIGADEFSVMITDCGITGIASPQDTICNSVQPVKAVLKNFGPYPLTSASIHWVINSQAQPTLAWNGNIPVNGTDTITLGSFQFVHNTPYNILVFSAMPNYAADTASWNDSITKTNLFVRTPPMLNLTTSNFNICQGDTAYITGTLTGTPPWAVTISDGTTSQTITNILNPAFVLPLKPLVTTNYTVLSVSDGGNCPSVSTTPFSVYLNPAPPATINPSGSAACCSGDSVTLMGTIGLNFSYQWLKNGVNIPNATNYVYFAKTGGAYTVKVTSPVGCSAVSAPVAVTVHPAPAVFLGNDTNLAPGALIQLNAGAGYTSYLWSTGANTQIISVDSSGTGLGTKTVWAKVTDNMGCKGTDTIRITFVINPGIGESGQSQFAVCQNVPNPALDYTVIAFEVPAEGPITFTLVNLLGQPVFVKKEHAFPGKNQIELNVSALESGIYHYHIEYKNQRITHKLVKIN